MEVSAETVLEQAATDKGGGPGRSSSLTADEYQLVVVEWNRTERSFPVGTCLDRLIDEQTERTPDAVATVFEDQQLTYRELGKRAQQLACYLQSQGVGRNTLVAICMNRSLEMLVGLLAIMKAGAAYLPLDPSFPPDRLALMLEDARPLLLLTQQKLRNHVGAQQARVVCLEELPASVWQGQDVPSHQGGRDADDLAYVLYTSGSTGRPKGVEIQHRALVNFLISMQQEPGIDAGDTLLAITTLSFDISGLELYLPLIAGARVVIATSETARDGKKLSALMERCGATIMQATPVTWRMLVDCGWQGSPLLKILCGGEAWTTKLASDLLSRCQSLWNMYGPTETTIWSAASRIEKDKPVAIGQPIANTTFYILDESGKPMPIGEPGELHIGGLGLARGYLGRAELTSERFIPDPFSARAGARLYKTGDVARRARDGSIEFLGRADQQIKLRGFRIELGEIEDALSKLIGIGQCAVIAKGDDAADKRIVAYFLPVGPQAPPAYEEIRSALKYRLPDYMIPSAIVAIDKMPLTPNGKIDRKALSQLKDEPVRPGTAKQGTAPRTPTELVLKQLWMQILGVPDLSVEDNFFELGGHSILAMDLATAIGNAFHVDVSLQDLFLAPTVEGQAKLISEASGQHVHNLIVPVQHGDPSRPPLFMIHAYHLYPLLPQRLGSDQAFYGVQEYSPGEWVGDWSLGAMMARYVQAIRLVQPRGPYFIGGFCSSAIPAFEVARQLQEANETVGRLILIDSLGKLPETNTFKRAADGTRLRQRLQVKEQKLAADTGFFTYLKTLAKEKSRHLSARAQRWWYSRLVRLYMRRGWPIPAFLRTKLVDGIRIVTLEATRNYVLKQLSGNINVYLSDDFQMQGNDTGISLWARHTSGEVKVTRLEGDHIAAFRPPHIDEFARVLRATLDAAIEECRNAPSTAEPDGALLAGRQRLMELSNKRSKS
jgi:amino acid adenylation domain-containing protein